MNTAICEKIIREFTLSNDDLVNIAASFRKDMERGLVDISESSMKMLKSYVKLPTGEEKGDFLALDFGGTNLRVVLVRLLGNGEYEILKKVAKPLVKEGEYNFISKEAKGEDLFDFIADMIGEVAEDRGKNYLLGHTFSFPSMQSNIYNASLITWTKEFYTQGVEGEVVNDLLKAALKRRGIKNVEPVSVINDTVAVLLASAYKNKNMQIGSIYATGFNTCYYEDKVDGGMVINLECGGFNRLGINYIDKILDETSAYPFQQRLEKMVSGRYMGELFTIALTEILEKNLENFTAVDISTMIADNSDDLKDVAKIMESKANVTLSTDELAYIKALAEVISLRSAKVVAATYVGILWHLFKDGEIKEQKIAVDGSVFEKMPKVQKTMADTLKILLEDEASKIELVLENGGSALGAAISCVLANN